MSAFWNNDDKIRSDIKGLESRIKELEKPPVVAEVCIVYGQNTEIWKELTQENILDEVDGYVKIEFATFYPSPMVVISAIGLKGKIGKKYVDTNYKFNICWVEKDCLIWHNKDIYAKERTRIEDKVNAKP